MFTVCLVVPTWAHYVNPFVHQPYWELYFATILQNAFSPREVSIEIVDLRGTSVDKLSEAVSKISEYDVFIYWFFRTNTATDIFFIKKQLKRQHPNSVHVAGGVHVEVCSEECEKIFDVIIIGPGEQLLVRAVMDIRAKRLQKTYRQNWKEVPFRDTPFPRRDFLPEHRIINTDQFAAYGKLRSTIMFASRGCIYHCAFCMLNIPSMLQVRSPAMIKAEMEYLIKHYQIQAILPKDEIVIHPNPKISSEFFSAIGSFNLIWRGQTTVLASYEQLKMAYESGCRELAIGIETVDDRVMKIINKSWQTKKKICDFIANAKKIGIRIRVCLIFGLPGESPDIVEKTIRFIKDNQIDYVNINGFAPLPGSHIYKNAKFYGIKTIDREWRKHAELLFRYSDEENGLGLPFEYEKETRFGKAFARDQIKHNILRLQKFLRTCKLFY